jgi:hypothetical protein
MQKKSLNITFSQRQKILFDFPLTYSIDGKVYKVAISDRDVSVNIPLPNKPVKIVMDPDVDLLAGFAVNGQ